MKTRRQKPTQKHGVYKLHINLPQSLVSVIAARAKRQYRTTASLIRETLAEKFKGVE